MVDSTSFSLSPMSPSRPQRVVVYGPPGVGKTTFAALWPQPVLIDIEHGADCVQGVMTLGTPNSTQDVLDMLTWLADYGAANGAKTVIIDSIDALEPIVHADVCREAGKPSIEAFDFGRGYVVARERMSRILKGCDACIQSGLEVLIIGHATEEIVHDPTGADYVRRTIALQRRSAELLIRWADSILYLDLDKTVRIDRQTKTGKASGDGRVIYTSQRPSALAKTRRPLPDIIEVGDDRTYSDFFRIWRQ